MPPKNKFTKEAIVEAAFEIAKLEGIDQITIRKVAEKAGCSVAPIYVNFADIAELKAAVIRQIHEISMEMLMTQHSPNPFLNIGIASLKFARQYPVLFKELILYNNTYVKDVQPQMGDMLDRMKLSPELHDLTEAQLMNILFKMQVFQLGLSVMDVGGLLPAQFTEDQLIGLMEEAGTDIISAVRLRGSDRTGDQQHKGEYRLED